MELGWVEPKLIARDDSTNNFSQGFPPAPFPNSASLSVHRPSYSTSTSTARPAIFLYTPTPIPFNNTKWPRSRECDLDMTERKKTVSNRQFELCGVEST